MKKTSRQNKILEIIKLENIERQDELVQKLIDAGIYVTQATVSRDIKELGLVKIQLKDKTYKYAVPEIAIKEETLGRFEKIFRNAVIDIKSAENLVVIKTVVGSAQSACAFLDRLEIPNIIGNIAGDDTILVVVDSKDASEEVMNIFREYL